MERSGSYGWTTPAKQRGHPGSGRRLVLRKIPDRFRSGDVAISPGDMNRMLIPSFKSLPIALYVSAT
jgi:hypothetical protein